MAAGPAPKHVKKAAPAPAAKPAPRSVAAPANDNRPRWLRWIAGAVLVIAGIAVVLYSTLR